MAKKEERPRPLFHADMISTRNGVGVAWRSAPKGAAVYIRRWITRCAVRFSRPPWWVPTSIRRAERQLSGDTSAT